MASPLSVKKNDYINNPKASDIYTPTWLSYWLYDLVEKSGMKKDIIFDPAIGDGHLTNEFWNMGSTIVGMDIVDKFDDIRVHYFRCGKFEDLDEYETSNFNTLLSAPLPQPDFIIMNPPFNGAPGKKLYPEVFLKKIEELFGNKIPVIVITPMGMLLNQRIRSSRWRYLRDNWKITSIISLPIDVFDNVAFHAEIVCFNTTGMEPHYFIPEEIIPAKMLVKPNGKQS